MSKLVIAIDGASGSGKSSTSVELAKIYHLDYLDTGLMYRLVSYVYLNDNPNHEDAPTVAKNLSQTFAWPLNPEDQTIIYQNQNISDKLRDEQVNSQVSQIASNPEVRKILIKWQQQLIQDSSGIILEGRDTTTVVAPDATFRFLLNSDLKTREQRRIEQNQGQQIDDLAKRDQQDSEVNDFVNPASGVIEINNSHHTLAQNVRHLRKIIDKK